MNIARLFDLSHAVSMPINMRIVQDSAYKALSFPDYEEGSRLSELTEQLAIALGTTARRPIGSPLELLVSFNGYPDEFALYWDGFICELGYSKPCIEIDQIAERLVASEAFCLS
jgi:hypothetical protein